MSALSCGPWTYNRFNKYEELLEGKKPDFLDVDKDGDKKESFKKAVSDKKKGGEKCDKCDGDHDSKDHDKKDKKMPPWLKDKKDVKESNCSSKKDKKKKIIEALLDGNLANNEVSAEVIADHMSDSWAEHILEQLG